MTTAPLGPLLGIGEVVMVLRHDFPDVTLSKVRFLEAEGLVNPMRTSSGHRKYAGEDVERLRYILRLQRDHYLPLKVIRDYLAAMDHGGESREGAEVVTGGAAALRPAAFQPSHTRIRLTRPELVASSGLDEATLEELEEFGLVRPSRAGFFDENALVVASVAAELLGYGIGPRHLRSFRAAANREIGLVSQVVKPLENRGTGTSRLRASEAARELLSLCVRLHVALVRTGLEG